MKTDALPGSKINGLKCLMFTMRLRMVRRLTDQSCVEYRISYILLNEQRLKINIINSHILYSVVSMVKLLLFRVDT